MAIKHHVMTSSNQNFCEKCEKIGKNHKNCGVTGLESLNCLFYTISRQKAEGKISFEENFIVGVNIMTSQWHNFGENMT